MTVDWAAEADRADELDRADSLAGFRDRFVIVDPDLVYLDGNSLGRLSRAARSRLLEVIDVDWGAGLIRSWDHWIDWPTTVGDRIGTVALGAAPGQVVVSDSTTVNFYKLMVAALDARADRRVVIADRHNFPTDRYVLESLAAARDLEIRWIEGDPIEGVGARDVAAALADDVAVVTLSHLEYRCGALVDVDAITAISHDAGALVVWDLSHSCGSVPVELDRWDVDFAVGCTYKYLNGGPGAPAWLYVRSSLLAAVRQPIWGWMGQQDLFEMGPDYQPEPTIRQFLCGTPSILALAAVDAGIDLIAEAGIDALRTKGSALTDYAIDLVDRGLPASFSVGSPREAVRRGSHVSVRHRDAREMCAQLRANKVLPDFRAPDSIRLGMAPLTTSFSDVQRALALLSSMAG